MPKNFTELRIPIPYGHIAAKVWGLPSADCVKVVAMHGYMDNAGTFDKLIPLLPDNYYVVAFDLPGHGYSSHVPYGTPYDDNTWALALKYVVEFVRFDKFTILGHSMGASIGWVAASTICPDQVERLIAIDQIKPITKDTVEASKDYGAMLAAFIEAEKKYKAPQPSFDPHTALDILIMAHEADGISVSRESAQSLLKRATRKSPDGKSLTFTRDGRLNTLLGHVSTTATLKDFYSSMKCEMLIIIGRDGINDLDNPDIKCILEAHAKHCRNFKSVIIDGDHFVHLNEPHNQKVAELIKEYIDDSKLNKKAAGLTINGA